jgi:hypothetical protein
MCCRVCKRTPPTVFAAGAKHFMAIKQRPIDTNQVSLELEGLQRRNLELQKERLRLVTRARALDKLCQLINRGYGRPTLKLMAKVRHLANNVQQLDMDIARVNARLASLAELAPRDSDPRQKRKMN